MTLEKMLLQNLAEWRPGNTRQTLFVEHPESGWRVELQADAVDTLGVRLWEVSLRRTTPLENPASLSEQSARLAQRVTGLLEPLRLVEVDQGRGLAQLRSVAPRQNDEALSYYELLRQTDGTTNLSRFSTTRNSNKRQAVAFTLTHEALGQLIKDLTA